MYQKAQTFFLLFLLFFIPLSNAQEYFDFDYEQFDQEIEGKDENQFKRYLEEIKNISIVLSNKYKSSLQLNRKKLNITQIVSINSCEIEIRTFTQYGMILRDVYDLGKERPFFSNRKYKGVYPLSFGVLSNWKDRSKIYFPSKKLRNKNKIKFKRLFLLCGSKYIYSYMKKKNESRRSKKRVVSFVGNIPQGKKSTSGMVYGPKESNWASPMEGETSLLQRIQAIRNAEKSIYQQNLGFRGDYIGQFLANEMIKKRGEGVDVKVLVDGIANFIKTFSSVEKGNSLAMYNNLMASGVRVFGYSCAGKIAINEFRGIDLPKLMRRNHEKMFIVDGEEAGQTDSSLAIVGGANISQSYFRMPGPGMDSWREFDSLIRGVIVADIRRAFLRNFNEKEFRYKTYKYDKKCFNHYDPITEAKEYQEFKAQHMKPYKISKKKKERVLAQKVWWNLKRLLEGYKPGISKDVETDPIDKLEYNLLEGVRFVVNRPEEKENYVLEAYIDLINSAKEEINIGNQFFMPDAELKAALRSAANRGVRINIVTNSEETNPGTELITIVGRYHYIDIVYANHEWLRSTMDWDPDDVRIYEWVGRKKGGKQEMGRFHAKYMTIDKKVALIGSHNLDNSSKNNSESVIIFENESAVTQMNEWYQQDIEYTERKTLQDMKWYHKPKGGYLIKLGFGRLIEKYL